MIGPEMVFCRLQISRLFSSSLVYTFLASQRLILPTGGYTAYYMILAREH